MCITWMISFFCMFMVAKEPKHVRYMDIVLCLCMVA